MGAQAVDLAVVQHQDAVGILHGGDALCDDDLGGSGDLFPERLADLGIGGGIHGAGRVVQDQHLGLAQQGAGDGQALLLAAGNVRAALLDPGIVLVGEALDEFIERFPDKYNTWIEQGGSNVSGGQKQRLTIARALLRKPKVLILDDSTSAVDTATDAKIRKAFREEIPGTTKIIIAQRISSVQDADRILVLDNGQINGLGTHEELLKTNTIYQEVYNSQTQSSGDFDKQGGEQ